MPMPREPIPVRLAATADLPSLATLIDRAIAVLQQGFLDAGQIEASRTIMGLDTQLVEDGTYLVAEPGGIIAGCGGWSRRATLFGGDHAVGRDARWLDPRVDAARIRAMYTDPSHARRGIGRSILRACEAEAIRSGFRRAELAATLAGEPLYRACGYAVLERFTAPAGDRDGVPLLRMGRTLAP